MQKGIVAPSDLKVTVGTTGDHWGSLDEHQFIADNVDSVSIGLR